MGRRIISCLNGMGRSLISCLNEIGRRIISCLNISCSDRTISIMMLATLRKMKMNGEKDHLLSKRNGEMDHSLPSPFNLQQSLQCEGIVIPLIHVYVVHVLGDSGGVVNSLDFCPASLKSLGCFYFRCVLSSQWKAVTVNF